MTSPRLLLVEFIAVDGMHRAFYYPFVQGWLRRQGVTTRWLRFGLAADWRRARPGRGMALPTDDTKVLVDTARAMQATHVYFSATPADELCLALTRGLPSPPAIASPPDTGAPPAGARAVPLGEIGGFLGQKGQPLPPDTVTGIEPDFAWEAGNTAARQADPLPYLVSPTFCRYNAPLQRTKLFAGLPLDRSVRDHGCSFCRRPPETAKASSDTAAALHTQLRALLRTHPPRPRLAIRILGAAVLPHLRAFAEGLLAQACPPSDFLLESRADDLVRWRHDLEDSLELIEGSGHRFDICLVGIESFAERDLELFNKGVSWRDNLAATELLLALEAQHPQSFAFARYAGLSLILYTPWTRLEDLALNYAIISGCGIEQLCGKLFTSRLRLYDDLPLHALALREGLTAREGYDDPELDTSRRYFYPDEVPWRFADPSLEAVNRLSVRLERQAATSQVPGDALAARLAALSKCHGALAVIETAIDVAIAAPTPSNASILCDSVEARCSSSTRSPPDKEALEEAYAGHWLAFDEGLKPVVRLEDWPEALAPAAREGLCQLRRRARDGMGDLFLSRDRAAVEAAAMLASQQEQREGHSLEPQETSRRLGELLGYPPCCADWFSRLTPRQRSSYAWLHIASRVATEGPVSPLLNPGVEWLVHHVPCALRCKRTLDQAHTLLCAFETRYGAAASLRLRRDLEAPWLLFVHSDGAAVQLLADGEVASRFRYSVGRSRLPDARAQAVVEGDEMVVAEQHLLVLRRGRLHAALGARAFLWWHEAAIQPELWGALLRLRTAAPPPADAAASSRAEPQPQQSRQEHSAGAGPTVSRDVELLAAAVAHLPPDGDYAGYRLSAGVEKHHSRLSVILEKGPSRLQLLLANRAQTPAFFLTVGAVALMHHPDTPLDTPEKRRASRLLAEAVVRQLATLRT
jgi:hypothetical protein